MPAGIGLVKRRAMYLQQVSMTEYESDAFRKHAILNVEPFPGFCITSIPTGYQICSELGGVLKLS